MNYGLRTTVAELQKAITLSVVDRHSYSNESLENSEINWNCSRFLATVLHRADLRPGVTSAAGFNAFVSDFEKLNNIVIDTGELFEKYWLRTINDQIAIAGTVSYACLTFSDVLAYRNELQFLRELQQNTPERKLSKEAFEILVEEYTNSHGVTLDTKGLYLNRYCTVKGDELSFSDIENYFSQYLDHWDSFRFLSAFKEAIEEDKVRLTIPLVELAGVIRSFRTLYPAMPALEELVGDKVLEPLDADIYVILFHDEKGYWNQFSDAVAGQLWNLMYFDEGLADKQQALKKWVDKTRMLDCHDALELCTHPARYSFCEEAYRFILDEEDLWGAADEMNKMLLDTSATRGDTNAVKNYSTTDVFGSLFHIYRELTDAYEQSMNFLVDQRSRGPIFKLIRAFVLHEKEYLPSLDGFARIRVLLAKGAESPFLLWRVSHDIVSRRPAVIPQLLTDSTLASLGFILIDELEFSQDSELHNCRLWSQAMALFLQASQGFEFGIEKTSQILFEAYLLLNSEKYTIRYYPGKQKKQTDLEKSYSKDRREKEVLDCVAKSKSGTEYLLPTLIETLTTLFSSYTETPRYKNGLVQFPMLQWDGLFWLMEAATYHRFKPQFTSKTSLLHTLSGEFLKSYLQLMETQETTVTDYQSGGERKGLLSWSERMERISKLKWLYPIYNLDQYGLLDQFLSPRIVMQVAKDKYDEGNRVKASQLRTHIGVLLQLIKNLFSPTIPNGFEKKNVERIKEKVEHQLIHYITHYTTEDPTIGKVDLFSMDREESLYSSADEALLPQLAIIINGSVNRQEIISALQKNGDLVKLLTICEFITSQGIRHTLIKEAKKTDVLAILDQLWIPEVQSILLKVSKYPELTDMLEECLVYFEVNVTDKKPMPNNVKTAYHIRMLLAYMKKDVTALEREAVPQGIARDSQELSLAEYKDFYRGLILIVDDPEEAYDIFTTLLTRYRKHTGLAVNRLTAAFNLAEKENTTAGFSTALEEWNEASASYSEQELLFLEPELSIILLNLYHQLNQHEKLDTLFMQLDLPYKMLPGVLEVWVDNLLKRNRRAEAFYWADQAKQYHEFDGQDDLPFLQQLNDKISGEEKIDELIVQYNRIFNSPAELLVKILPPRINGKSSLTEFAVQEFVLAADIMLDKIKAVSAIKNEDKYNDIMEALLEGRINSYGWKVSGQKRGGYSGAKGPDPGERDLPVYGADNKIIINGEALVYRGKGTAIPHLNKLFNYTHQRGTLLVIFYDTGDRGDDFEGNWQTYQDSILPACNFPQGYEPVGKFQDVTTDFKVPNSAIKVGKTPLASDKVIYHIFIQINYSVAP